MVGLFLLPDVLHLYWGVCVFVFGGGKCHMPDVCIYFVQHSSAARRLLSIMYLRT